MSSEPSVKPTADQSIELNTAHQAYDEALEILCMLPTWPKVCALADIQADMGFAQVSEVEQCLGELQRRGFQIKLSAEGGEATLSSNVKVWIDPEGSEAAQSAAQIYFESVYS